MRGPATAHVGKTPKVAQARVVVPFEDNRHLTSLLGEFDANLALLEDRLGIEAHAHGNVVILTGSEASCAMCLPLKGLRSPSLTIASSAVASPIR